jgi:nucleoside-diphosphate-sugar epimerase
MELGLRGKKALVTGASKGIGRACAEVLAEEGCDVVLVARTASDLETARAAIISKNNVAVRVLALDLSQSRNADRLAAECSDTEILINNAGAIPGGNIDSVDEARWREWKMVPKIDRIYVNERARRELGWQPVYDFASLVDRLCAGKDIRSPLARLVGSKGYYRGAEQVTSNSEAWR